MAILDPKYKECLSKNEKLIVDLDGGYGYATTFLEESFGGMVRLGHNVDDLLRIIQIISDEQPELIEEIKQHIIDGTLQS